MSSEPQTELSDPLARESNVRNQLRSTGERSRRAVGENAQFCRLMGALARRASQRVSRRRCPRDVPPLQRASISGDAQRGEREVARCVAGLLSAPAGEMLNDPSRRALALRACACGTLTPCSLPFAGQARPSPESQKSDTSSKACETRAVRSFGFLSAVLLCAASIGCSSEPLTVQGEPAGFAAVVLTVQGAGAVDQRLRAYGLDVTGNAEQVCSDAGGFDVSLDRRHVACERSASTHGVSVYTRGVGSVELPELQSPVFSAQAARLAASGNGALFVAGADGSALTPLASDAALGKVSSAPQWSSSGRYIAALTEQGVVVWEVASRAVAQVLSGYDAFEWLPGRERLAASKPGSLLFVDGDAQQASERADPELAGLWPGFSSSGEWLAYPRATEIVVLNHVTGEERVIAADIRNCWLAWSPTDDVLALDDASGPELRFWSPGAERTVPRPDEAYGTIEWSPDGSLLRDYRNEGSLIYDGRTGEVLARLDGRLQWSPSGQNLTTMTTDDSVWLADRVGGEPRLLTDYATRVTWFPDSQHLALQIENELYVTDVTGGAPRLVAEIAR